MGRRKGKGNCRYLEDKRKLAPHYKSFRKHVQPKLNPIFSRYKFNLATQGTDTIGECSIQIDPSVSPVIQPPRKVPLALHDKLFQELTRMESEGILSKVTEPTQWLNSLVIVETNNKLRVCLDPRDLNKAIH